VILVPIKQNGRAPRAPGRSTQQRHHPDDSAILQGACDATDLAALEARFWAKVDRNGPGGCWIWTASTTGAGYGQFYAGPKGDGSKRPALAHRVAYALEVGPIPDGKQLDHTCHNRDASCPGGRSCLHRRCVRPNHLEPVPQRTNLLRGKGPSAVNARKTHCPQGHPYDLLNTSFTEDGHRECRTCRSEQRRRWWEQHRPAVSRENAAKTHCPHGHPYDEVNTYVNPRGARICRACKHNRTLARLRKAA
jgi:hypothetical protein